MPAPRITDERARSRDALIEDGVRLFNQGRFKDCLPYFDRALRLDPSSGPAYYFRSFALGALGRADQALSDFRRSLQGSQGTLQAHLQTAAFLQKLGRLPQALTEVRAALRKDPRSQAALALMAEILWQQAETADALDALAQALEEGPPSAGLRMRQAEFFGALGETEDARRSIEAALALEPPSAELLLRAAEVHSRLGDDESDLAAALRAVEADGRSAPARLRASRLCLWKGLWPQAREHAERAAALGASPAETRRLQAAARLFQDGPQAALPELDRAVHADPDGPEIRVLRAEALRRLGRSAEARTDLKVSLAAWPFQLAAFLNLALLRAAEGKASPSSEQEYLMSRVPKEIADLRRAAAKPSTWEAALEAVLKGMGGNRSLTATFLWSESGPPRLVRHIHYFPRDILVELQTRLRFGDPDRVLKQFAALVEREPGEAYIYSHRGEVFLWLGRYDDAAEDFSKARSLNDALLWPKIGLAAAHLMRGRPKEALEILEYASKHGGSESILMTWRAETERRLGRPAEALRALERMQDPFPFRPSAWINLALAKADLGNEKAMRKIFTDLSVRMPELMADVRREVPATAIAPAPRLRRALETALRMMRGNRSRWMYTYFDGSDRLKLAPVHRPRAEEIPLAMRGFPWTVRDVVTSRRP